MTPNLQSYCPTLLSCSLVKLFSYPTLHSCSPTLHSCCLVKLFSYLIKLFNYPTLHSCCPNLLFSCPTLLSSTPLISFTYRETFRDDNNYRNSENNYINKKNNYKTTNGHAANTRLCALGGWRAFSSLCARISFVAIATGNSPAARPSP